MVDADFLAAFMDDDLIEQLNGMPTSIVERAREHFERKYSFSLRGNSGQERRHQKQRQGTDIDEIFKEVKEELDRFVGIKNELRCEVFIDRSLQGWEGRYDPNFLYIDVGYQPRKSGLSTPASQMTIVLAHEYAHHLTFCALKPVPQALFSTFIEGVAFGLERVAADLFTKKYASSAFQHFALRETIDLLEDFESVRQLSASPLSVSSYACHARGNALFAVLESERGQDIYRQILHGEFKW